MLSLTALIASLFVATSVSIVEPVDGETYDGDWLPFRVIVENENEEPDSVHYSLNGSSVIQIPRLNTDWPTYMQNYQNTGYSESPAPHDNTVLWSAPVTGLNHEFPTPVVVNSVVYYPSNMGTDSLYALDAATGELIWKYRVGMTDDAVTVSDGRVYTASDSLWCLDAASGNRIWASAEASADGGTPIAVGEKLYACGAHSASCFNSSDGTLEWQIPLNGYCASCMAYREGYIYIPTSNGPLYALNAVTGEIVWQNFDSVDGFWDSSPVVVDGMIYINGSDGYTRAIDEVTGETVWTAQSGVIGGLTATPAYHGERLYFANACNTYYCVNCSNGAAIWTYEGTNQHGSSGIADGLVFYGEITEFGSPDSSRVVALDWETGAEVWSFATLCVEFGMGFQSSPSITDGIMYYACTDGYLYAFGTGLKYTYSEEYFYADVGANELIVTSWDNGAAVAADTITFTVTQTGIALEPTGQLNLCANPNPMRTNTSVSFTLEEPGRICLRVFDLSGREISTLIDQELDSGVHSIQWNGYGDNGRPLPSGLFLCRIECEGAVETTGLCLLK